MISHAVPRFTPCRLLRNGHAQTLGAYLLPGQLPAYRAARHVVELDDGDRIVLHDDRPDGWRDGDRATLLLHGLAGCHQSPYMQRIAAKLNARGVRTFRMDLRGCGAGMALAKLPYHSGRSDDAAGALAEIARLCPQSPVCMVGFSLGGNIALKLVGEVAGDPPPNLDRAVAVCPPIDLLACTKALQLPVNRFYDRYFVRLLLRHHHRRLQCVPGAAAVALSERPRRLFDLDDVLTARLWGFDNAEDYYHQSSSGRFLHAVEVPTLLLCAADDPLIPVDAFVGANASTAVRIHIAEGGGHLGFLGRKGVDPDRRWMDWRVVDWVTAGI